MNLDHIRETVLAPVYAEAKAAYDRRHSHKAAKDLRDAATYMLANDIQRKAGK